MTSFVLTAHSVYQLMENRENLISYEQSQFSKIIPEERIQEAFEIGFTFFDDLYKQLQRDEASIPKGGWELHQYLCGILRVTSIMDKDIHEKVGFLFLRSALSFCFSKYFSFIGVSVYRFPSVKEAFAQKNPEVIQLFPDTTNYTFEIFGTNRLKAESLPCVILINGRDIDINAANFLNYSFRFEFVRS